MQTAIFILFVIFVLYIVYRFGLLLFKMKQPMIYPESDKEMAFIHIYPQKTIQLSRPSFQKGGLILYGCMIIYFVVVLLLWIYFESISWPLLLLAIVPYLQIQHVFNMFAILQDGVLFGGRFIRWKYIQSYEWIEINTNHLIYSFGEELNNGYELKIKTKLLSLPVSLIVTDKEVKEDLTETLKQCIK